MDAKSNSGSAPQPLHEAADNSGMDEDVEKEWAELGARLRAAGPQKFNEVLAGMRDVVEAQEIIQRFDTQLFFRGRPKKTYSA